MAEWTCDSCGKTEAWGPTWSTFGALAAWDECGRKGVLAFCSPACAGKTSDKQKAARLPTVRRRGYGVTIRWPRQQNNT